MSTEIRSKQSRHRTRLDYRWALVLTVLLGCMVSALLSRSSPAANAMSDNRHAKRAQQSTPQSKASLQIKANEKPNSIDVGNLTAALAGQSDRSDKVIDLDGLGLSARRLNSASNAAVSAHSAYILNPLPLQTGNPILVNFDDAGLFDLVGSRYPHVSFSSPGGSIIAWTPNNPASRPYCASVGGFGFTNGKADFVINFVNPVKNLKFKIIDWDDFLTIALVDVYKNNVLTHQNLPIGGQGPRGSPTVVDLTWVSDVTKVIVHHITDAGPWLR